MSLGIRLVQRFPDDLGAYLVLSEAYAQQAKNAWKRKDMGAIRRGLVQSIEVLTSTTAIRVIMNGAPFSWIEKGNWRSDPNHFEERSGPLKPLHFTAAQHVLDRRDRLHAAHGSIREILKPKIAAMLMIINTTA